MIKYAAVISLVCIVAFGCKPSNQANNEASEKHSAQRVPAVAPTVTAEQWMRTVEETFDKVNSTRLHDKKNPVYVEDAGKPDENGVTEFFACFDKAPPKCELSASGSRDGFRKIQFFKEPVMEFFEFSAKFSQGVGEPSVRAYISLKDCSSPMIVLQPTFRGDTWIFFEEFGLVLNGALVINRKLDFSQVDRDNSHKSVSESAHIVLNPQEVDALRRMVDAEQVLIRLTGQKGYAGIDEDGVKNFIRGVSELLPIHDAIKQSTDKLGQVKDPACPS